MNHTYFKLLMGLCIITFLSGCLYPSDELSENQIPYEDQLDSVQNAIETYQSNNNGMLPIETKDNQTPIFEKYMIDFQTLKDHNIMSSLPSNSFEKGGVYKYVLINPEDHVQVKLIDLSITDEVRKVHMELNTYRSKHLYPPFGKEIAKGIYSLNYEKLDMDHEPYVVSPYSNQNLPIVIDTDGELYVDYRIDLQKALEENDHTYKNGDDIRYIIPEDSPFVPVYSLPYTIEKDEPVFMLEDR